jgi:hypothetical protein
MASGRGREGLDVRSSIIWLVAVALGPVASSPEAAPAVQKQKKAAQKELSAELARLVEADQRDQDAWTDDSRDEEFTRNQTVRRNRVMEILAAGGLGPLEDWGHAAMLLQHGDFPEDYLLAHVLALRAGQENVAFGRFLTAAAFDRFLMNIEREQVLGTQSTSPDPSVPIPSVLPDSLRAVFELPARAGGEAKKRGKAPSARELAKLLALAGAAPAGTTTAEEPAWLARGRELVLSGALESARDCFEAAQLLAQSSAVADLELAHVCACAACLKGHAEGHELAARTLDRLLLALGRPQCLGTATDGAGKPREPVQLAPEVVLRGYGLLGPQKK